MKYIIGAVILGLSIASFAFAQTPNIRQEAAEKFRAQRQQAAEALKARKVEFQNTVQVKRDEMKNQIETKRAEVKTRLQNVRDEKKRQAAERVYDKVNELNSRQTTHFINVLNQIAEVLDRVRSRADKAEANSLNVSGARTAIANAQTAIAQARSAVEAQAGKTYSFQVTTEEKLRSDVGTARQALHADLKAVKDQVKVARDAVRQGAVALAKIPRVNEVEVEVSP